MSEAKIAAHAAPSPKERVIKRMTATEREALGTLSVADQIVTNAIKMFRDDRYRIVPGMKRDLRLVESTMERLLKRFLDTIPTEQVKSYVHTLQDTSYTTGVRCRARYGNRNLDDEYGMYLTFEQINGLVEACKEKCHYCGYNTEGIRRCKLRKIFDQIPNDAPDDDGYGCPYYRVV